MPYTKFDHSSIIDEGWFNTTDWKLWQDILLPYTVFYVGIIADIKLLESREQKRGDRVLGSARAQTASLSNSGII